eukprot:1161815-Pleurochrysis_carterae.AAC.1
MSTGYRSSGALRWQSFQQARSPAVAREWGATGSLSAVTVGSEMPRTSREWIIADIVALVAVDAALASMARMRSKSLPLPLHA